MRPIPSEKTNQRTSCLQGYSLVTNRNDKSSTKIDTSDKRISSGLLVLANNNKQMKFASNGTLSPSNRSHEPLDIEYSKVNGRLSTTTTSAVYNNGSNNSVNTVTFTSRPNSVRHIKKGNFSIQSGFGQPLKILSPVSATNGHANGNSNGCLPVVDSTEVIGRTPKGKSYNSASLYMEGFYNPVFSGGEGGGSSNSSGKPSPNNEKFHHFTHFDGSSYPVNINGLLDTDSDEFSSSVFSEEDFQEKFHLNETPSPTDSLCNSFHSTEEEDEHPFFLKVRDVRNPDSSRELKIVSSKGTIRGVKNRVKAGIATFLNHNTGISKKNFLQLEKGRIVLYVTSVMIVRDTFEKCKKVKNILQTHMVKYEEKDIFMSRENQRELADRLGIQSIQVPQVFVEGHHLGGVGDIERMNENGELRKIFKKYKKVSHSTSCDVCGGYRYVPCRVCHGSRKSLHRNHFTTEFCALRCIVCDENGLIRCEACNIDNESYTENTNTKL